MSFFLQKNSNTIIHKKSKLIIKISSYNKNFIYFFLYKISKSNYFFSSIFKLPKTYKRWTILRSPFVNKKSRVHLGFKLCTWIISFDYMLNNKLFNNLNWKNIDFLIIQDIKKCATVKTQFRITKTRYSYFF